MDTKKRAHTPNTITIVIYLIGPSFDESLIKISSSLLPHSLVYTYEWIVIDLLIF